MKVLLTGSAGFIGGAVGDLLDAAGHEVVRIDLMLELAHGATAPPPHTHQLDVRDALQWRGLLSGVDVVCHQAAMVGAGLTAADLPLFTSHNALGTAVLLAAMADADVDRLVLASSMVVYGDGRYACEQHGVQSVADRGLVDLDAGRFDHECGECGQPLTWQAVDEDTPLAPTSSYAASKVAQEHLAAAWARQTRGRVVALRYHNVYGPHMPRDTPYAGVAAIFRSALERGESPLVFEDGAQMRDFVHVSDVARANLLAIDAVAGDAAAFAAYNICSGLPVSILDVARILARGRGVEPRVTGQYRAGDVRHIVASPARARDELGFVAEVTPSTGIAGFAAAPLRA